MAQNISIENLPTWAKLEVSKGNLLAFGQTLIPEATLKTATPSVPVKEILLMEYLNLAKQTLYGMTSRKNIAFLKKSRKIYVRLWHLEAFLAESRQKTRSEIKVKHQTRPVAGRVLSDTEGYPLFWDFKTDSLTYNQTQK